MKQPYILIIFLFILFLYSCHKDFGLPIGSGSVIIINEGNYGHSRNSDVSVYDPNRKVVSNNVFYQENGLPPGNVAQSLYLIGDTAYIVMNNSAKVIVADVKNNFKYISSINIPNSSPRFFMPVDQRRAYVTELYSNKIWIVDYRADTLIKAISVSGWTEQIISWGGKVHAILKLDPSTDQIISNISLASDPGSMALTPQGDLFVLTPQQTSPAQNARIYQIDMSSFSIRRKIDFTPSRTPNYMRYSSFSNQFLFSDSGGIYTMLPGDIVIPANTFIHSNNWNVYGLNADPATGDIYISDAVDYQQASHIMRYSTSGTLLDHFAAGIISNGFVFK
jgi:hypothetical protein